MFYPYSRTGRTLIWCDTRQRCPLERRFLMSSSAPVTSSAGATSNAVTFERAWRTGGIASVVCFIIAYALVGNPPQVGASSDALVAFYTGERARILIAAFISGFGVLNLMWFWAALRVTLAECGKDGWGAAATASSAAVGAVFMLLISVSAALAFSIAGSGSPALVSALNDFVWAGAVLSSFPRAMMVMSAAFGL
ncbi:MAG TPA: hypothetical protein VGY57_09245, partial [Vicinamibacterales bacterium]|nr:hypothetical protein [Vicinamibacterales bacterium]